MLVDLDISLDLKTEIDVVSPFGIKKIQVQYEWVPFYSSHCQKIGHQAHKCKKLAMNKTAPAPKKVWVPVSKLSNEGEKLETLDPLANAKKLVEASANIDKVFAPVYDDGFSKPKSPRRIVNSSKGDEFSSSSGQVLIPNDNSFLSL